MADASLLSRVTILAVGICHYNDPHFKDLRGPKRDIERLRELLVDNSSTALFKPQQFIARVDLDSNELRQLLSEYVMNRSAENDILLFYFSGHGVPIGRSDFGFCTTDTIVHPLTNLPLSLSVVKFSEFLSSLSVANVIPIVIIDACYSGTAGRTLRITPLEAISSINDQIHTIAASSYALLCSCADYQTTIDTPDGGLFSYYLHQVATEGLPLSVKNESMLTLRDIFTKLQERVLTCSGDVVPRLYLGPTLPEFPFVMNTQFSLRRYTLSNSYVSIIKELWNGGNERELSPEEIRSLCGNGAYGNHNKLSFAPWGLVETVPNSKRRRLTERGRLFIQNRLEVPKTVIQDPRTNQVIAAENTVYVRYADFQ